MSEAEAEAGVGPVGEDRWADWPEPWVGTECDVRTVVSAIPRHVKDGFRYDTIPWRRFPHFYGRGDEIPELLTTLATADAQAAAKALERLWNGLHHQGGTIEAAALAVPFLLRAAATGSPGLRAKTLALVAASGRCQHLGDATREGLLQVAEEPLMIGPVDCPVDWTIQAARDAITADLHLLLPLLAGPDPDPDPEVRSAAAFVLALATGETTRITAALHDRLAADDDPAVQASLVPAIARLGREHHDAHVAGWARDLWSAPERPRHIRIGAGIAWLCLVEDPVPDDLRAFLTHPDTARAGDLFQRVPWFPWADPAIGLRRCVHDMLAPQTARDPSAWTRLPD